MEEPHAKSGDRSDSQAKDLPDQMDDRTYALRRYEARIGFWKVAVGTALVGLASVLVPGAVQFWDLKFQNARQDAQHEITKAETQRDTITQFIDTALNEDIEHRIRMAEYFSVVTTGAEKDSWTKYYSNLVTRRNDTKNAILEREQERNTIELNANRSDAETIRLVTLRLELAWLYGELGRAIRGESVVPTVNERQQFGEETCSGSTSRDANPAHLHPAIRSRVEELLSKLQSEGIPFELFEGYRTPFRQETLWNQGRTSPGVKVTWVGPWRSIHEYGLGADLVPKVQGNWSWDTSGEKAAWWARLDELTPTVGLEPLYDRNGRRTELPHVQSPGVSAADLRNGNLPDGGDESWWANIRTNLDTWLECGKPPPSQGLSDLFADLATD